eukprot:757725-Hanusia_phi.AAC.2
MLGGPAESASHLLEAHQASIQDPQYPSRVARAGCVRPSGLLEGFLQQLHLLDRAQTSGRRPRAAHPLPLFLRHLQLVGEQRQDAHENLVEGRPRSSLYQSSHGGGRPNDAEGSDEVSSRSVAAVDSPAHFQEKQVVVLRLHAAHHQLDALHRKAVGLVSLAPCVGPVEVGEERLEDELRKRWSQALADLPEQARCCFFHSSIQPLPVGIRRDVDIDKDRRHELRKMLGNLSDAEPKVRTSLQVVAEADNVVDEGGENEREVGAILVARELDEDLTAERIELRKLHLPQEKLGDPHHVFREAPELQVAGLDECVQDFDSALQLLKLPPGELLAHDLLEIEDDFRQCLRIRQSMHSQRLHGASIGFAAL